MFNYCLTLEDFHNDHPIGDAYTVYYETHCRFRIELKSAVSFNHHQLVICGVSHPKDQGLQVGNQALPNGPQKKSM